MAGEASFIPGEQDAVDAMRDSFRRYVSQPAQKRALLGFGAAAGIVMLAVAISLRSPPLGPILGFSLYAVAVGMVLLPIALLIHYLRIAATARRVFRQDRGMHVEHRYRWSDDGLAFHSSAGEGRIAWADLYRWSKGRNSFLLWTNERVCLYLPRRALDEPQADDLRQTAMRFGPPHF